MATQGVEDEFPWSEGLVSSCRNLIKKPWPFTRVPLKGSMRVTIRDLQGYYNNVGT